MLIADIVPYGRNARHNEKAIPKIAESIKEFGCAARSAWNRARTP